MRITKRGNRQSAGSTGRLSLSDFSRGVAGRTDETLLPFSQAAETYNYRTAGGALTTSFGVRVLSVLDCEMDELPCAPLKVWYYKRYDNQLNARDDSVIVYGEDGYLYFRRLGGESYRYTRMPGSYFSAAPSAVNYRLQGRDVLMVCAPGEDMGIWDGTSMVRRIGGTPPIANMAVHYERLFATIDGARNRVWFSDDLNPANWTVSLTEAGFIEMADERGDLLKVVPFLDYLYVFREYGITRVTAYGDQSAFSVTQLYTGSGKIYAETVTVCGDRVYFLAADGLYVFDGLNAYRVFAQFDRLWADNKNAAGAFHNGKFYLACNLLYRDEPPGTANNTVLEIDLAADAVTPLRGIDVRAFCACKSTQMNKLIFVGNFGTHRRYVAELDDSGTLFGTPLLKSWKSALSDTGTPDRRKTVRSVSLLCRYPATLTVRGEKAERRVEIGGAETVQTFRLDVSGRRFGIEFSSDTAEAYIANPSFTVVSG